MIIEKKYYQGYLWYSDKQCPLVLDGQSEWGIEIGEATNPFIIEGQLWDEESRTSISIKYIDGHYLKNEIVLNGEYDFVEYIPRRMSNVKKLLFARSWKTVEDELCEGFNTKKLENVVFKGLKMKEE